MNDELKPGDRVRVRANPGRIGILSDEVDGPPHRRKVYVNFLDGSGSQFILQKSLEKIENEIERPYEMARKGRFGRVADLRGSITYYRLSGKLSNLIYSLNTTNTEFFAYQFKPVLQYLDSRSNGILIADEVGLGKTIEAGLIWTELRARADAKRLLVVCPAMLREKWRSELSLRFGMEAEIVDAERLQQRLEDAVQRPKTSFALIASIQGLRPTKDRGDGSSNSATARLSSFIDELDIDESLLDLLIIDEAHYIRNRETSSYKIASLLRTITEGVVLLSATPIQLDNQDLFTLLNLIDSESFPYLYSFKTIVYETEPIVNLRDRILAGGVSKRDYIESLKRASQSWFFEDNKQLKYMLKNPPLEDELNSPKVRSELVDRLDKINPLTKIVTRTLKRDVHEFRVQRSPVMYKVEMTHEEREFYEQVTDAVKDYCEDLSMSEGFMLTIPQRQLSSSIAAACKGWIDKAKLSEEEVFEIYGDDEEDTVRPAPRLGELLTILTDIAKECGNYSYLESIDSKYHELVNTLKQYWSENPEKKIVLFSYYRNTLNYLNRRLREDGINTALLYGGMDKQAVLNEFKLESGPNILLSSEVASEGVDLQFSSVLINYDLPWNPAKIEQRIGRIDRIGQEAERILIWNFIYENSIDERIYERLFQRLRIFEQALGSMESMLGSEIRSLSYELLSHKLTRKQEEERIDRARFAIENRNRQQAELEERSDQLIAHGEFIQNKVRESKDLGRFVTGEDLATYVLDFFKKKYEGTRLSQSDQNPLLFDIDLSSEFHIAFTNFLQEDFRQSVTELLSDQPPKLLFENKLGKEPYGVERVTQDHPLIRFIGSELKKEDSTFYMPLSAVELLASVAGIDQKGIYLYSIAHWTVSGGKDFERLEYIVKRLSDDTLIRGVDAESFVNTAALQGKDWLGTAGVLDYEEIASELENCRAELEDGFEVFCQEKSRENDDFVDFKIDSLKRNLENSIEKIDERIDKYLNHGDEKQKRMIPAEEGKKKKLRNKIELLIAGFDSKRDLRSEQREVSYGVIRVI